MSVAESAVVARDTGVEAVRRTTDGPEPAAERARAGPTLLAADPRTATRLLASPALGHATGAVVRAHALTRAQQAYGNRFAQRVVAGLGRSSPPAAQRQCACGGTCKDCQASASSTPSILGRRPVIQPQRDGAAAGADGAVAAATVMPDGSAGAPLDESTRAVMETRFGADFASVRVHTDADAADAAAAIGARAYTVGRDVYFGAGQYAPATRDGGRLLAHELAHTIQQGGEAPVEPATKAADTLAVGAADDPLERQADRAADAVVDAPAAVALSADRGSAVRRLTWREAWEATGGRVVGAAVSGAEYLGEKAGELYQAGREALAGLVERYAPGLLALLRGDVIDTLKGMIADGIDGLFGGLLSRLRRGGLVALLEDTFGGVVGLITKVAGELARGDCASLTKAVEAIGTFAKALVGSTIDNIRRSIAAVREFFNDVWETLGAPVLDVIRRVAGAVWDWITAKARWIWDKTAPIREGFARAWQWLKEKFNLAWETSGGVVEWLQGKALAAWDQIKGYVEPLVGPLKTAATVTAALSPLGPTVAVVKTAPSLWSAVQWLWKNWDKTEIVVEARATLNDQVFPAVQEGVAQVTPVVNEESSWLTEQTTAAVNAFARLMDALGVTAMLRLARQVVGSAWEEFTEFAATVKGKVVKLFQDVSDVLGKIWEFIRPIAAVVAKLTVLALNPWLLPIVLTGWAWKLVPDCVKGPIIDLVLDLMVMVLRALPDFASFGEAWAEGKQKIIQTLLDVRQMDLEHKIEVSNRIARIMSGEDLSWVANLVSAARQMPDHLEGQFEDALLGVNLTEPLPFERTEAPSPEVGTRTAVEAGSLAPENREVLTAPHLGPDTLVVQPVAELQLEPGVIRDLDMPTQEGAVKEFGASDDPSRSLTALQADLRGETLGPAAPQEAAVTGGAPPTTAEQPDVEQQLQLLMNQQPPVNCETTKTEQPAKEADVPDHLKIGPLTRSQRGRYLLDQMWKGVKNWFSCHKWSLILGLIGVLIVLIVLEILTGGAVTAALPLIMEIVGAIMIGVAIVQVAKDVGEYFIKAVSGDIAGAAKSLAHGIAVGAIELIFALLFNLGAVIKALKSGLKASLEAAAKAVKTTVKGAVEAAEELGRIGLRGVKTAGRNIATLARAVVKNGKLIVEGLGERFGQGIHTLEEFIKRLWAKLRFKKFRLLIQGGMWELQGEINPWYTIAKGRLRDVTREEKGALFLTEEDVRRLKRAESPLPGALQTTEVGTYRELTKKGIPRDLLTPDHIPSRAALVKAAEEKALKEGRTLTQAERDLINQEGITVAIREEIHKGYSATYAGRNTAARIALDASDLGKAFGRDAEEILKGLAGEGKLTLEFVGSYLEAYRRNVARGVFAYSKEIDDMLLRYVEMAKKLSAGKP